MALECVIINTGVIVIEYVHSTLFISTIIANLIISVLYPFLHIKEPEIFLIWALSSVVFHTISYVTYITRPINSHPNVCRRFLRMTLPEKMWKFILCRWLYKYVEKYAIISHLIHMTGMLLFCLLFGLYLNPLLHESYNREDSLKGDEIAVGQFAFISSICLGLDIFIMEILIALSMIPVLPISALIYLCSYCCCCPKVRRVMNEKQDNDEDSDDEEAEFFRKFKKGETLQQLLLYIYQNNKIIFKKANFRDHCEELTTNVASSPKKRDNESFFREEVISKDQPRDESFITNEVTRKITEMELLDDISENECPDTSLTPVRAYDPALQAFIEDVHREFDLDSDSNDKSISINQRRSEEKKHLQIKNMKDKRTRLLSEHIQPANKIVKRTFKKTGASFKVIRGRTSMKKIDRGVLCTI